jgi:hypothetical protein
VRRNLVARQHPVQDRQLPLQARRALADDLSRTERQGRTVVEEEPIELVQLVPQSLAVQSSTFPGYGSQKWPLKCVPISCPSR